MLCCVSVFGGGAICLRPSYELPCPAYPAAATGGMATETRRDERHVRCNKSDIFILFLRIPITRDNDAEILCLSLFLAPPHTLKQQPSLGHSAGPRRLDQHPSKRTPHFVRPFPPKASPTRISKLRRRPTHDPTQLRRGRIREVSVEVLFGGP